MTQKRVWRNAQVMTCDREMRALPDAAIVTAGDRIEWLGAERELPRELENPAPGIEHVDLRGRWVTPGLVDCHTHLVFAGHRAGEWGELLAGATYEEIARRGGGILSTVNATRRASEAELFEQSAARLECLLAEGVTTVEIKSGYGLTLDDERKMLRVARALGERYPVSVRTTFLAAHAVPPEFAGRADAYIDEVVRHWLPVLQAEGLIDAVDVFCERIAFDTAQAGRLFEAAAALGLPLRMHAEQLSNIGATQLATRLRALSCDHLEHASEEDVLAMSTSGTIAVLLPTAFLHLGETKLPPIALLRQHRTSIAIASDCNPGSAPSPSVLLAGALATRLFRLTPAEVLVGITRHAATACGAAGRGALAKDACADFVIWDVDVLDEILYWIGRNSATAVVQAGEIVRGSL